MTPGWPFPKPKLDRVPKPDPAPRLRAPVLSYGLSRAKLRPPVLKKAKGVLSARQVQVMDMVCAGKMPAEISGITGISVNTVEIHIHRAKQKIGAGGRRLHVAIARYCILRAGLKLPFRNAGLAYVDADGKPIEVSRMIAAINAVADIEA